MSGPECYIHLDGDMKDDHGDPMICVHMKLSHTFADNMVKHVQPGNHETCEMFVNVLRDLAVGAASFWGEVKLSELLAETG